MARPPVEFFEEYDAFRTRWDWAMRGMVDGDVVQAKLTVADMRAFVDRWQGKIGIGLQEGESRSERGAAAVDLTIAEEKSRHSLENRSRRLPITSPDVSTYLRPG